MITKWVKFIGATKEQTNWGGNDDGNKYLVVGEIYEVSNVDIRSWHTKIELVGFEGLKFNSVCFE